MRTGTLRYILAGIFALGLSGAAAASDDHEYAKALRDKGEVLPLEQVLAKARQHYPGRVIETELERKRAGYVYEIKIAGDDGTVRELKYDARTAELLKEERKD